MYCGVVAASPAFKESELVAVQHKRVSEPHMVRGAPRRDPSRSGVLHMRRQTRRFGFVAWRSLGNTFPPIGCRTAVPTIQRALGSRDPGPAQSRRDAALRPRSR